MGRADLRGMLRRTFGILVGCAVVAGAVATPALAAGVATPLLKGGTLGALRRHNDTVDHDERLTFREFRTYAKTGVLPATVTPARVVARKATRVSHQAARLSITARHDHPVFIPGETLHLSLAVADLVSYAARHGLAVPGTIRGDVARALPSARRRFPETMWVAPIDEPSGFREGMAGRTRLLNGLGAFARGE